MNLHSAVMLEEYEDKLRLLEKFQQRKLAIEALTTGIRQQTLTTEQQLDMLEKLQEWD